jgi:hypothetical protein
VPQQTSERAVAHKVFSQRQQNRTIEAKLFLHPPTCQPPPSPKAEHGVPDDAISADVKSFRHLESTGGHGNPEWLLEE